MKIKSRIDLYNFLTVVFAILTVVSVGGIAEVSIYRAMLNIVVFGMLTVKCFEKENQLRRILKNRRKARKVSLSVYKGSGKTAAGHVA